MAIAALVACARQPVLPRFEDYRVVPTFQGTPAPVDLASDPEAPRFRTRLRDAAPTGPNFADHFTVASWGCGTDCHVLAVIDARTGRVTFAGGYEVGVTFQRDSRLLIANPTEALVERGWQFPGDCGQTWVPDTTYFEWTGDALKPLRTTSPCATP